MNSLEMVILLLRNCDDLMRQTLTSSFETLFCLLWTGITVTMSSSVRNMSCLKLFSTCCRCSWSFIVVTWVSVFLYFQYFIRLTAHLFCLFSEIWYPLRFSTRDNEPSCILNTPPFFEFYFYKVTLVPGRHSYHLSS